MQPRTCTGYLRNERVFNLWAIAVIQACGPVGGAGTRTNPRRRSCQRKPPHQPSTGSIEVEGNIKREAQRSTWILYLANEEAWLIFAWGSATVSIVPEADHVEWMPLASAIESCLARYVFLSPLISSYDHSDPHEPGPAPKSPPKQSHPSYPAWSYFSSPNP